MKKFDDRSVKSAVKYYKNSIIPLIKEWLENCITEEEYSVLQDINNFSIKILDKYNYFLTNTDKFISLTPEKYSLLEQEIGITPEKKEIFKKMFVNYMYEEKLCRKKEIIINLKNYLNIDYCPYCNASELIGDMELVRFHLDHFLPKVTYPLFSVFLFNLIPACDACDSNKGVTPNRHINPYFEDFNNLATFYLCDETSVFFKYIENSYAENQLSSFRILLDSNDDTDTITKNTIDEVFKLNILYDIPSYKKIILIDFQKLNNQWNKDYLKEVTKITKSHSQDLAQIIDLPLDENEINKNRFSKLKRDILIPIIGNNYI